MKPRRWYWLLALAGTTLLTCQSGTLQRRSEASPAESSTQREHRVKQAQAKLHTTYIVVSQQAFFFERGRFSTNLKELGLDIKPETASYRYRLFLLPKPRASKPAWQQPTWSIALPKQPHLKSYVGIVWAGKLASTNEITTFTQYCESKQPTVQLPPAPTFQNGKKGLEATCPQGFSTLHLTLPLQ